MIARASSKTQTHPQHLTCFNVEENFACKCHIVTILLARACERGLVIFHALHSNQCHDAFKCFAVYLCISAPVALGPSFVYAHTHIEHHQNICNHRKIVEMSLSSSAGGSCPISSTGASPSNAIGRLPVLKGCQCADMRERLSCRSY